MKKSLIFILCSAFLLAICLMVGTYSAHGFGLPALDSPIFRLRLYRVLCGFIVGAGLSCAGAVLQAILRNPLAEPYVLGVSSGGALGAAIAIFLGLSSSLFFLPASAFLFAGLTLMLVYTLAKAGGKLSIYSLILSGTIVSAVCSSILMFLISTAPIEGMHSILWWMLGDLGMADKNLLLICGILISAGICSSWLISKELNALSLGSEMAHHVGIRTETAIRLGLVLATVTTAAAVSLCGIIGFVGLIVPHVVRGITGPDHRKLIPATAVAGGVFLAVCDAVARVALFNYQGPVELPVGVVTAVIGGPFFLVILFKRRKRGWVE